MRLWKFLLEHQKPRLTQRLPGLQAGIMDIACTGQYWHGPATLTGRGRRNPEAGLRDFPFRIIAV
jgi:hypothetical protein